MPVCHHTTHLESKTRGWVTCVDLGNVKQRADVILKGGDHRVFFEDREFCFSRCSFMNGKVREMDFFSWEHVMGVQTRLPRGCTVAYI